MERGPMALFGAIVAVGLGPAMWLGAQFGNAGATPAKPPAVTSEQKPGTVKTGDNGGAAGAAPEDPSILLENRPRADYKPLRRGPSSSPSASTSTKPDPSADPSATTPTPSDKPSTPPTESTTDPTSPPTGGDPGGGGGVPPSPPTQPDAGTYGATSVIFPAI